ncbi:MAG: pyridoxamine 5'-phosphate oxidase family protein [Anaerolineaceae bacterium]|nr:pyridoxamine 5'-phosphate oxidase family protein [Anaerolineaceae bacterium]
MTTLSPEKQSLIDAFLASPHIARLATVDAAGAPHVVPVWYGWDGAVLWVSSFANTRKITHIEHNPALSVAVDIVEPDGTTRAVILEGRAELIRQPRELVHQKSTWIYTRYLGLDGVLAADPQSWIVDPLNLLIKLVPLHVSTWGF